MKTCTIVLIIHFQAKYVFERRFTAKHLTMFGFFSTYSQSVRAKKKSFFDPGFNRCLNTDFPRSLRCNFLTYLAPGVVVESAHFGSRSPSSLGSERSGLHFRRISSCFLNCSSRKIPNAPAPQLGLPVGFPLRGVFGSFFFPPGEVWARLYLCPQAELCSLHARLDSASCRSCEFDQRIRNTSYTTI